MVLFRESLRIFFPKVKIDLFYNVENLLWNMR